MRIELAAGAPARRASAASDAVCALCSARAALAASDPALPRDPVLATALRRFLDAMRSAAEQAVAQAVELADDLRAADAAYSMTERAIVRAAR